MTCHILKDSAGNSSNIWLQNEVKTRENEEGVYGEVVHKEISQALWSMVVVNRLEQ